jgi:predicted nucleotidyltransferase
LGVDKVAAAYEKLIDSFVKWAQTEDNIRAAVVIGSRARVDHPADEWSDLDVLILANDPELYWATADWLHHVGNPWLTFVEPTPDGNGLERRVLFEGGLDVDMELFRWMAVETAELLAYAYPSAGEEHARALVERLFSGREHP